MGTEKQLPASAKKLREARQRGDVAKSRDLSACFAQLAGFCLVGYYCCRSNGLIGFTRELFSLSTDFSSENMLVFLVDALKRVLWIVLPILSCIAVTVFVAEVMQVGVVVSWEAVRPRWSRLDPFSNLKRIIGLESSAAGAGSASSRFVFRTARAALICCAGLLAFSSVAMSIMNCLPEVETGRGADLVQLAVLSCATVLSAGLAFGFVCGILDYLFARRSRSKRLAMDAEELKREMKDREGDPHLRQARKELHRALGTVATLDRIRRASVLIRDRQSKRT